MKKIVIDLKRLNLTNDQLKKLHAALHKTMAAQLQKISKPSTKKTPKKSASVKTVKESVLESMHESVGEEVLEAATQTASLQVTFTNVNPGLSNLTAILHNEQHTLIQSGIVHFGSVQSGDVIAIQVDSLGSTTVTIDVSADPTQLNFPPGHHNDNFFVN